METESHAMIFKFILICFLLCFDVRAGDGFQMPPQEIDGARYCDFDGPRKNYNASDLLQCIDVLVADFVDRESSAENAKSQWNGSTGRQISFADVFANFFNEDQSLLHQSASLPADTTSGYYQSNYPAISGGTFDSSPGFQLNLFDALSSISRHDDYKCVPRILCEMASGKLPGRSLAKQTSSLFEFFGKNALTEWLATVDVAGASPLLNFGRAMILGYSNRGNSLACYRAFPKCPRDSNELVHYLNNYNGGFFRLFNRLQFGKQRRFKGSPVVAAADAMLLAQMPFVETAWGAVPAPTTCPMNLPSSISFMSLLRALKFYDKSMSKAEKEEIYFRDGLL
ncbi:uncharacterized protein LOC122397906 [Colletes gigas]|uniref:uncharacterized protein LOC122397906 n=1 Tax=Colletes gigas TaxID=935657 RepID=UPI001C9A70A6|nr:uncharacterized protein LOC122397906 [Colletes gigas]